MDLAEMRVITTLVMCLQISASEPQPHGADKWGSRPATFPQNSQQNILLGIEQRLRVLDSIRHTVTRNELSLETLSNRIEVIETRLTGLQNTIQHKFDSIITAVSSAEMKYELFVDQTSRKIQTDLDRINHKLSTAESRLETSVNKIQNQMELSFQNAETKQINIGNELLKVHSGIGMLKSELVNTEQRYNRTLGTLINHLQEIHNEHTDKKEHLKNLTSLVIGLQPKKNEGWTQSDAPVIPNQQIQIIKTEISSEAHKIGSKMSNMYDDMWKSVRDLETIFKMALNDNNNKTKELHQELRQMLLEEKRDTESFLEVVIQSTMAAVHTKLSDLQTDLQIIIASNGMQGDSCHKIKSILENKVAFILTRIYETFTNRTDKFLKQVEDMEMLLKGESKQLSTALAKTNHYIITLAQESGIDHKQLDTSINNIAEKTDEIAMSSQEIQMQTQEINETLLKYQKTLKELKGTLYHEFESKGNKSFNTVNETTTNNPISALEANYSNGIIKIITDRANKNDSTDKEDNRNSKSIEMSLTKLNKSITISDLEAVIGESKNIKSEDTKISLSTNSEEKDRDDEDDFDAQEEFVEEDMKPVDTTQLMLSYIKYLKNHLSAQEFLEDAVPGSKYESLQDMAQQLKRTGAVPKEMVKNIEQMALEQIENGQMLVQHTKYETLTDDNYDEVYDSPQRK